MKKALLLSGLLALAPLSHAQTVLDDFSGDLSNWSSTIILNNSTAPFNTASLAISGGALTYVTSTFDGIEQAAHIFSGASLGIGQELQLDVAVTGNQDFGLYVGIAPTAVVGAGSTRASYVSVYLRGSGGDAGTVYTRGFAGSSEYGLIGSGGAPAGGVSSLFIARTAADTYELGYYDSSDARQRLTTRVDATNTAAAIGLYTDVRAAGTLGSVDNLTVVPEPSTYALVLGALTLGFVVYRRRRA